MEEKEKYDIIFVIKGGIYMDCNQIIIDIIIPIISSLIGGGLTLIGVLITIKFENKKRKEEIRIANKPLFYLINPMQKYDYKNASDFEFTSKDEEVNGFVEIIFRNTDNAILVFDNISVNGKKYYSQNGNIVDKNTTFNIYLYPSKDTKIADAEIVFSINDSLNNNYKYKLGYKSKESKYIDIFEEIK